MIDWRQWWKEVSRRKYEIKILAPEMEIMKETPWSRIRGQKKSDNKELLEIVGNGSPTGSVLEETLAVSASTLINMEKWHSRIRLAEWVKCVENPKSQRKESQW